MRRLFLLSFAAAAACCVPAFASIDSGLLAMVPAGAKSVASIDVQRAKSSELGQHLLSKTQEDHNFQQFVDQTGFDPRRDLQTVVVAGSGATSSPTAHNGSFAILARGTFDVGRIAATAKAKGAVTETYQGVTLYIESGKTHSSGFAFPDTGLAVMADIGTLRNIIANRSAPVTLDPVLQDQISKVGDNDAWFASTSPSFGVGNPLQIAGQKGIPTQALQSIIQASGGVRFGDMVAVTLNAVAKSPQDAQSIADVARFLGSVVQMQRQNDPHAEVLASSIDNMKLATNGEQVQISVSVPEQSLETLADMSAKRRQQTHVR